MSVDNIVILEREKMPTPEQWARAISEHGFELQMDVEFDAAAFIGYLPCRYRNEECGFEYSIGEIEDGLLGNFTSRVCEFLKNLFLYDLRRNLWAGVDLR